MKKLFFLLLVAAQPALARETLLSDIVKPVQHSYESLGRDNNSIDATYYDSHFRNPKDAIRDAVDFFRLKPKQVQHLKNQKSLQAALQRCVFYTKGAYGPHISAQQSAQLASSLVKDLEDQMILAPEAFVAQGIDVDIVGSGCGVLLFSKLNNEFVLLTAVGAD